MNLLRLVFSYRRMCFRGRDPRFDAFRTRPFALLGFWLMQAIWTWANTAPVTLAWTIYRDVYYHHDTRAMYGRDLLAILFWASGLFIEALADEQRLHYLRTRKSSDKILRDGLWRWSRHPNYFGEIMHWFGISLACMPALESLAIQQPFWTRIVTLAPLLMTSFLLLAVSGMPLSEKYHAQRMYRHGNWSVYVDYLNTTSPLIPLPPNIWCRLPSFVKCILCERTSWSQPPSDASIHIRERESTDAATS
jgi:steroid 5-alpha reductase family enzyme